MPTYTTPDPIDLAINLSAGAIEVVASDRLDTVVTVTPTKPDKAVDRRGAEETKIEFDGERLTVRGPRPRLSWIGPTESVDVRVDLPSGSRLAAETSTGYVRSTGRLGATRVKCSLGAVEIEASDDLWIRAGHGNVLVGTADGQVEITADHGQIRVGEVTGDSTLKASHGSITISEIGGDLDAKLSYGDLEVGRALASVDAKTAYGSIAVREVSSGSVQLESGYGQLDVAVRPGVPVWLDLSSKEGRVRNDLVGAGIPGDQEGSVAVRARTTYGNINVRRG